MGNLWSPEFLSKYGFMWTLIVRKKIGFISVFGFLDSCSGCCCSRSGQDFAPREEEPCT